MIRTVVDFALNNRFLILAAALLLMIWGAISFHNLPVEAYPDVANNYVQIITQWPGHAAEEVERLLTVPIETEMNGLEGLEVMRSVSLYGLSSVRLTFKDGTDNYFARQQVFERLSSAKDHIPAGFEPKSGSVSAKQPSFAPCAIAGSQVFFCSSEPNA